MGHSIRTGISYMYEPGFNRAILPLLEAGEIDALEWSFDTVKTLASLPDWTAELLKEFSEAGRLYGHGVYYSIFSGAWLKRHDGWFIHLENVLKEYRFQHISEHFGFMTSSNAHEGAPLPLPFSKDTLTLGIDRLKRLSQACQIPIGIENLAFAYSPKDAREQGAFLEALMEPVNGFVLLDLHNVYCQAANFGIDALELVRSYPLHRVKELHVSGGSWESSPYSNNLIRRDTHNDAIPEAVYELLNATLPLCPNVEVVIVERLGDTLKDEADEVLFREEFLRVKSIVRDAKHLPVSNGLFNPIPHLHSAEINPENPFLQHQQSLILEALHTVDNALDAKQRLLNDPKIDQNLWKIHEWEPSMIDTAMQLGIKWGINHQQEE